MAVNPRTEAEARAKAASEDLARQVEILRQELTRLAGELNRTGRRSAAAAGNAASDGIEALRAQGEVAMDSLRESAGELEREMVRCVRDRPVTSLVFAVGAGYLFGRLMQR